MIELVADVKIDGTKLSEIVSDIEDILNIRIYPKNLTEENFKTVDDICKLVMRNRTLDLLRIIASIVVIGFRVTATYTNVM